MTIERPQARSWTAIRARVLKRDGYQYQTCGDVRPLAFDGSLSVHHKAPRAHRGSDDPDNLVTLCDLCHGGVLHGYGKWLGVPQFPQPERQQAKLNLLSIREDYEWFVHLPREQFVKVQKEMWLERGIEKAPSRE